MARLFEDLACAIVAIGLWELGSWLWLEVQWRMGGERLTDEFLEMLRQRFEEPNEMEYCPPAEDKYPHDYEDPDYIS